MTTMCQELLLSLVALSLCVLSHACYVTNVGNATCSSRNCNLLTGSFQNKTGFFPTNPRPFGGINYEYFQDLAPTGVPGRSFKFLSQGPAGNVSECCNLCARTPACQFFRYFPSGTTDGHQAVTNRGGSAAFFYATPFPVCNLPTASCGSYDRNDGTRRCILFSFESNRFEFPNGTQCAGPSVRGCYPDVTGSSQGNVIGPNWIRDFDDIRADGTMRTSTDQNRRPRSYFGGSCNPYVNGTVNDDPHFVGGDGIRFDFNGQIGKSFCLVTDERLHINMAMGGYLDDRLYGATALDNGKAIRSWITVLNFLWKDAHGGRHTLYLEARKGKEQERALGFIASAQLDGQPFSLSQVGEKVEGVGARVTYAAQGKRGPYDQDEFSVEIPGVISGSITARAAHPLLQTPSEAFVHFNLRLNEFKPSPSVHGVLGQTLREDGSRLMKTLEYKILTSLLRSPIQADGASGQGYLEGTTEDYVTSSINEPDCAFTKFT